MSRLKVKVRKKLFYVNEVQKKAGVALLKPKEDENISMQ
jgi:hypothetical protein